MPKASKVKNHLVNCRVRVKDDEIVITLANEPSLTREYCEYMDRFMNERGYSLAMSMTDEEKQEMRNGFTGKKLVKKEFKCAIKMACYEYAISMSRRGYNVYTQIKHCLRPALEPIVEEDHFETVLNEVAQIVVNDMLKKFQKHVKD